MDFTRLKLFMDDLSKNLNPGNAIQIYLGGKKVFSYASGYNDLESRTPMTGEELFNIYSCSKVATVTAGMQLIEQGKILLSDPLYEYIPEFKHMYVKSKNGEIKEAVNPITIGDLFSMTAGFTYHIDTTGFQKARMITDGRMDTVTTIKCIAEDPLVFEPGTHWNYSICHDVLGGVISIVSGMDFSDYMKKHIFEPLEMEECYYHHTEETFKKTANQYWFIPDADPGHTMVEAQMSAKDRKGTFKNVGKKDPNPIGPEFESGGAGIITTVSDYAKFAAALANYGTGLNGAQILSRYAVELMRTNRLTDVQLKDFGGVQHRGCGYGLGVRTHMNPSVSGVMSNIGEFGWGGAAGAYVMADPQIRLGVFFVQHTINPRETYYQPRLRNVIYSCL